MAMAQEVERDGAYTGQHGVALGSRFSCCLKALELRPITRATATAQRTGLAADPTDGHCSREGSKPYTDPG